jgi:RecB family exonuclease
MRGTLLGCPHRFYLERILGLSKPPERPRLDAIDALSFGSLLHTIAEVFFRQHGPAFCRGGGTLDAWLGTVRGLAEREFEVFLDRHPLRGPSAIERERERVIAHAQQFLRYEWALGAREFSGAELAIGDPEPVPVGAPGEYLYVEGKIDRVDLRAPGRLELRDLKTGRARDLSERPLELETDLQLGVYVLALEAAGLVPGARPVAAAYVYSSTARDPERRFEGDLFAALHGHAETWIAAARALLAAGAFVRTPSIDDCRYCPFVPHCGERAQVRSGEKLERVAGDPALGGFLALKRRHGSER